PPSPGHTPPATLAPTTHRYRYRYLLSTSPRPAQDVPPVPHLAVGADVIPWTLRISTRAKRLRIIVRPAGVEVVAPVGWPMHGPRGVEAFVKSKAAWVQGAVRKVAARTPVAAPTSPPAPCVDGATLLYHGRPIVLAVAEVARATAHVVIDEAAGRVDVAMRAGGDAAADEAAVRAALVHWLRREALHDGRRWAEEYGVRLGRSATDVRLTNAGRRWGSCSAAGVVRLHWRLAQAPPGVFEYVVAHEIAHLAVHDHSARFWATVKRLMPRYEVERTALKAWERAMAGGGWVP
ncbi:MAG: SprT family zinc-dependent metalloprotease, partial [Ardenticatenales bacterium]